MVCPERSPEYIPHTLAGLKMAINRGDGYTVALEWNRAFPDVFGYQVAYNIYYSSVRDDVFSEDVKFVSLLDEDGYFNANILGLTPGDTYYFAVKATEWDPAWVALSQLPTVDGLWIYPEGMLLADITEDDATIFISDIDMFPAYGIVQIGAELIRYSSKNNALNSLIVADPAIDRGFLETTARIHTTDGYDGFVLRDNPNVRFWKGYEDPNEKVFQATVSFDYPNHARTDADGYRTITQDLLTTNLGGVDDSLADFPSYDFTGWRRTDPAAYLNGDCVGTYFGGELFCADGYDGVGRQIRGVSINEESMRRQEYLLDTLGTGSPCVLVRRVRTGIRCSCYLPTVEHGDDRCPTCFGTGFLTGYEQFFNPRRADGRIMVRFSPATEDLKFENAGLESVFHPACWTLAYPTVKDRDFIIRFNEDGTEEFRYEILDVERNRLLDSFTGRQIFNVNRVRKTDPIYQWRAIRSTANIPSTLVTSISMTSGPGGILPHTHDITINSDGISSLAQINQTTSHSGAGGQLHSHPIINGIISEILGHTHLIIL